MINLFITRNNTKGIAIAEAALIIPILVGIVFLMIEFGNVYYLINNLNQAARSAARYASLTPSYTQQDLTNNSGASSLFSDVSNFSLTISPSVGSAKSVGTSIIVTTQYAYTPLLNPFGFLSSNTTWSPILKGSSTIRSEVAYAP